MSELIEQYDGKTTLEELRELLSRTGLHSIIVNWDKTLEKDYAESYDSHLYEVSGTCSLLGFIDNFFILGLSVTKYGIKVPYGVDMFLAENIIKGKLGVGGNIQYTLKLPKAVCKEYLADLIVKEFRMSTDAFTNFMSYCNYSEVEGKEEFIVWGISEEEVMEEFF